MSFTWGRLGKRKVLRPLDQVKQQDARNVPLPISLGVGCGLKLTHPVSQSIQRRQREPARQTLFLVQKEPVLYTPVDEMVLKFEQRSFGEAGPLEVLRLTLGPSGVHIEHLLKLRKKVKKMLLSDSSIAL